MPRLSRVGMLVRTGDAEVSLISQHKSLSELYAELLIRHREIERLTAAGKSICTFCNCTLSHHGGDLRCTCAVTSRSFHSNECDEIVKVKRALVLIEELQEI